LEANRLREETKALPPGNEREALLKKARQADTGAHVSEWLSRRVCNRRIEPNRNLDLPAELPPMAESFGNAFTVVEVTADDTSTQLWIALAKPGQALTLVLAAAPEGSTAAVLDVTLTPKQQEMFQELKLEPGDIHKIAE
jgi:hypothetical protein